jgi:hypothetical protein
VILVRKAADKVRIKIFVILLSKEINEHVLSSNKVTNNFAGLITSDLGSDVVRRLPVGPHCFQRS